MSKPQNQQQRERILALINRNGAMSIASIAATIGATSRSTQASIMAMVNEGLLQSTGSIRPALYERPTNAKGIKGNRISMHDRQTFTGVDWNTATLRPGCMDHLKHPSRRGDIRLMHTGSMLHMASSVSPFTYINTKEQKL